MSNSAFIYDAVRTPRAKGKMGSPLSQVKPVDLLAGLLNGLRDRHNLDTALVDDVVMGCVMPVGEQGACVAKTAAMPLLLINPSSTSGLMTCGRKTGIKRSYLTSSTCLRRIPRNLHNP